MVLSNIELASLTTRQSKPAAADRGQSRGSCFSMEPGQRIAQTVNYMQQSLDQALQVPKLARMANISPSHFFAVFKRQTGFAPMDFFIRLRVQAACEFLDATKLSVKEVAAKLGYDDPFYFSRVFKAVSSVAPTEYRRLTDAAKETVRNHVWPEEDRLVSLSARLLIPT